MREAVTPAPLTLYGMISAAPTADLALECSGTGKTLVARALANQASAGGTRISFFMVKGAQLLSKWLGESERQLRLIFEQARRLAPSIIFFDEIDGVAPVRSSKQVGVYRSCILRTFARGAQLTRLLPIAGRDSLVHRCDAASPYGRLGRPRPGATVPHR